MKAVNLLPADQRGAAKAAAAPTPGSSAGSAGAFAVLGALALGVVAIAGYVLTGNTINERQAKLDSLTAQEQAIEAKVGDLKPYADFAQLASARVATIKDLAGRRFDWDQTLADLSRAIPANVTVSSLSADVGSGSGSSGGSSLRGAIAAPAISLTGCTTSQREVARLMARLRNVDGVTRVSLSRSAKPDEATASTASAAGSPTAGATGASESGCGAGSPPQFELVMFFERAADATQSPSATTGSSTASTASSSSSASTASTSGTSTTTSTSGAVSP
jgi:Tfp pilus assembly protein PilN